jgi:hypothetical protein
MTHSSIEPSPYRAYGSLSDAAEARAPAQVILLAQSLREERDREKVGSLLGVLGRLRERLIA